jgi:hypothetical protein
LNSDKAWKAFFTGHRQAVNQLFLPQIVEDVLHCLCIQASFVLYQTIRAFDDGNELAVFDNAEDIPNKFGIQL